MRVVTNAMFQFQVVVVGPAAAFGASRASFSRPEPRADPPQKPIVRACPLAPNFFNPAGHTVTILPTCLGRTEQPWPAIGSLQVVTPREDVFLQVQL